jgi:hypothetical protein
MSPLEVDCEGFGRLRFPAGRPNDNSDFLIRASADRETLELLAFFDSRGIGGEFAGSLAEKLLQHLEGRRRYLLVCRPLELTTWATLLNFIDANRLAPKRILTNMGFVDFTPKKQSILDDAVRQVEVLLGPGAASSRFAEYYAGSNGETIPLFAMTYEDAYRRKVEALAATLSLIVVDTPHVSPEIRVERRRPKAFFDALEETRRFNRSIAGATVVDLPAFGETLTYDAVHYTNAGNDLIFRTLREHL